MFADVTWLILMQPLSMDERCISPTKWPCYGCEGLWGFSRAWLSVPSSLHMPLAAWWVTGRQQQVFSAFL